MDGWVIGWMEGLQLFLQKKAFLMHKIQLCTPEFFTWRDLCIQSGGKTSWSITCLSTSKITKGKNQLV